MQATVQSINQKPAITARLIGGFFSYLFHPVFVPLYVVLFLLYVHPNAFTGFSAMHKKQTILIVSLNLVFFPLITVLLLKAIGFIDSLYLRSQRDRIIPYIATGIFFFWAYTVFRQQPRYPMILTSFILGIFLASSAALIANIYQKVSMHAIGMGGWLGVFLLIAYTETQLMTWPISLVLLIAGIVCSSRLWLNEHRPVEIYTGLLIGVVSQVVAAVYLF